MMGIIAESGGATAEERSIVTEMPGTTRDLVSESADIAGIPVRLIDTAGSRADEDKIEQIGVDRSRRVIADVDAVLLVLEQSAAYCGEDDRLHEQLEAVSSVVAFNKSDLLSVWTALRRAEYAERWPCVKISALTGLGIDSLRVAVQSHLFGDAGADRDCLMVTNLRHCRCLEATQRQLAGAVEALRAGLSEEFILVDLPSGLRKLGEITGETSVDEVLGEIFSRFCIDK